MWPFKVNPCSIIITNHSNESHLKNKWLIIMVKWSALLALRHYGCKLTLMCWTLYSEMIFLNSNPWKEWLKPRGSANISLKHERWISTTPEINILLHQCPFKGELKRFVVQLFVGKRSHSAPKRGVSAYQKRNLRKLEDYLNYTDIRYTLLIPPPPLFFLPSKVT